MRFPYLSTEAQKSEGSESLEGEKEGGKAKMEEWRGRRERGRRWGRVGRD